jgi:hypothetical protein
MGRRAIAVRAAGISLIVVLGALAGLISAKSFQMTSGPATIGQGSFGQARPVGLWWLPIRIAAVTLPATLPSTISVSSSKPVNLTATTPQFLVGSGTASASGFAFVVNETIAAPASQELEIVVKVSVNGTTPISIKGYVETQSTPPLGTLSFTFYFSPGAASTAHLLIENLRFTSLSCISVGMCP